MKERPILFFADRLYPHIGGIEVHGDHFIKHFKDHPHFPLATENPFFLFFNDGRWIEELKKLRSQYPQAYFIYRTGGNEIIKAPLKKEIIPDHRERQNYWAEVLNQTIDLLITNSTYTEKRLREQKISTPFFRSVGGVDSQALKLSRNKKESQLKIFCAARFVPYKNHQLLLAVAHQLVKRGYSFELRLAGEGPLLVQMQRWAKEKGLTSHVKFLGAIDNKQCCKEVAQADLYMQLSSDYITKVPGGSYIHCEGMGRSILEAITAGTFVIAGKSGALAEIVNEERGVLLELTSAKQVADAVEPFLRTTRPKRKFTDIYSWKHVFKQYEKIMRDWDGTACRHGKV